MDRAFILEHVELALLAQSQLRLCYLTLTRVVNSNISALTISCNECDLSSADKEKLMDLCTQLNNVISEIPLSTSTLLDVHVILRNITEELGSTITEY